MHPDYPMYIDCLNEDIYELVQYLVFSGLR